MLDKLIQMMKPLLLYYRYIHEHLYRHLTYYYTTIHTIILYIGKTLAFALPIINYILQQASLGNEDYNTHYTCRHAYALIIAPTRELALQITKVLKDLTIHIKQYKRIISIVSIVGGMSEHKQRRLLGPKSRPPDIIVGTHVVMT